MPLSAGSAAGRGSASGVVSGGAWQLHFEAGAPASELAGSAQPWRALAQGGRAYIRYAALRCLTRMRPCCWLIAAGAHLGPRVRPLLVVQRAARAPPGGAPRQRVLAVNEVFKPNWARLSGPHPHDVVADVSRRNSCL